MDKDYRRVNFFDATFYLDTELFEPYHKPKAHIKYINVASNHPHSNKPELIKSISTSNPKLSANNKVFKSHAIYYISVYRVKNSIYTHYWKFLQL